MSSKFYVGNLSYDTTESQLRDFFQGCGEIKEIKIITDYQTKRSKGFGFITFAPDVDSSLVLKLNGNELDGRKVNIDTAKEKERSGGSGSGGGRQGSGRYSN